MTSVRGRDTDSSLVKLSLICPKCRSTLCWTEKSIVCSRCSLSYPIENGIPVIRQNAGYYHELLPKDRMHELIRRSREVGWQTALAEQIDKAPERNRGALRTVFADESRAAFKAVLPPLEGKRVLDLGCGTGITSVGLARWAAEVVACDLTYERVEFLASRANEMGLSNIKPVCAGDTRPLPFADSSFDCVILNGVLEWSAAHGNDPVRAGQLAFLRDIRRILKADGCLYIGIENRYGYRYFLGAPEDHTGVKFAALAPRWLADVLVKRSNGHPYRTYTYGYRAMSSLLGEAGFQSKRFFAPIPDYRGFRLIRALDRPSNLFASTAKGWRGRLKEKLEHNRWLTPSFAVVAGPSDVASSWVEELATELASNHSICNDGRFPTVRVSATSTAGLIIALGREAIVRVPLDPINHARVLRNFEGLQRAQAVAQSCNGFIAPKPIASGTFRGAAFTAESFVSGMQYGALSSQEKAMCDRQVFDLLIELKTLRDDRHYNLRLLDVWQREVVDPLNAFVETLRTVEDRRLAAELLQLAGSIGQVQIPLAFTHGDFWSGNLLFAGERQPLVLIDWDRWADDTFATHDLLHFICYRRVLRNGTTWASEFSAWLEGSGGDATELEATSRFADRLSLGWNWKPVAGLAYWVREASGHHASKIELDPEWTSRVVRGAVPMLLRQISRYYNVAG